MWKSLHERYLTTTAFSKSTVHTTLSWMGYTGQSKTEYVIKWELHSANLPSMDALMNEGLLVTMLTEFFGDRSRPQYGAALSALLTWE